jgi:hypothetical protein
VKERCLLDLFDQVWWQIHGPRGRRREMRDPARVSVQVGRTCAHDRHEGIESGVARHAAWTRS